MKVSYSTTPQTRAGSVDFHGLRQDLRDRLDDDHMRLKAFGGRTSGHHHRYVVAHVRLQDRTYRRLRDEDDEALRTVYDNNNSANNNNNASID